MILEVLLHQKDFTIYLLSTGHLFPFRRCLGSPWCGVGLPESVGFEEPTFLAFSLIACPVHHCPAISSLIFRPVYWDEDSDLILKPCRTFLFPQGILSHISYVNLSCFALQELFVETIAKDAYVYAQQGKRKTLQRKDLGMGACSVLVLAKGCCNGGFFYLFGGAEVIMDLFFLSLKMGEKNFYQRLH